MMKRSLLLFLALLVSLSLVACGEEEYSPLAEGEIRVWFLDVGEGDCTLIQTATATLLVDTGEADAALSRKIVQKLEKAGVETIDCLVLTHPHSDHVGGVPAILEAFTVKECAMPLTVDENEAFSDALDALLGGGVTARILEAGRSYTYGDLTLDFLSPARDAEYTAVNNQSAVFRVAYGAATLLMMGDAEIAVEEDILSRYSADDLQSALLKVGHHGAGGGSSYAFLSVVAPTYAVISVGAENTYGHPDEEVLWRLQAVGATVYRTDREGDIVFTGTREGFTDPE